MVHGGDTVGYEIKYGKKPVDFSANISPLGMPEAVKKAIIDAVEDADKYPDPLSRRLTEKTAQFHNTKKKYIIFGNGAADLIFRLVAALKPKQALITAPAFAEYEQALKTENCVVKKYMLDEKNEFCPDENFINKITKHTDIVFICQPNNPTGQLCSRSLLYKIIDKCKKTDTFLAVDECFADFLEDEKSASLINEIEHNKKIMIFKAFTKMYAMAGVRLGYALCSNKSLIEKMRKCQQPWSVSYLAQQAGIAALEQKEYVEEVRKIVKKEKCYIKNELEKVGMRVFEPAANYIFFYCDIDAFDEKLMENGFLIRDCSNYKGLKKGYYRVAVKKHDENQSLIDAINKIRSEVTKKG